MKKQIVGIVVLMLVATTVVSATNINVKKDIQPTASGVDVPVWKKGDSWTYNCHWINYAYDNSGTLWYMENYNDTETRTVTDDTGNNYTMKTTGKITDGRTTFGKYLFKFTPFTKIIDDFVLRKTDLGTFQEFYQEKGLVFWLIGSIGLPIPVQYTHFYEINFTPPYRTLPFPFDAGTPGTIPGGSDIYREKASLFWGLITLSNSPAKSYPYSPVTYHCEMANITIPAGTYNAYNISIDYTYGLGSTHIWRYYVPELGYVAKIHETADWDSTGKPGTIWEYELVSTTYTP